MSERDELVARLLTASGEITQADRDGRHYVADPADLDCAASLLERDGAELERLRAEVERLTTERDGPRYRCPQCDHLRLELGEARAALARAEAVKRDEERLDFVERHLCRAGDVRDQNGQVTGIMKCWQVVTQCDDSLRDTIDLLRAAIDAAQKAGM